MNSEYKQHLLKKYGYDNHSKIQTTMKRLKITHRQDFYNYLDNPNIDDYIKSHTYTYNVYSPSPTMNYMNNTYNYINNQSIHSS